MDYKFTFVIFTLPATRGHWCNLYSGRTYICCFLLYYAFSFVWYDLYCGAMYSLENTVIHNYTTATTKCGPHTVDIELNYYYYTTNRITRVNDRTVSTEGAAQQQF